MGSNEIISLNRRSSKIRPNTSDYQKRKSKLVVTTNLGASPAINPITTNEISENMVNNNSQSHSPIRLYSGSKPVLNLNKQKSFPAGLHQSNFES